MKTFRFTLCVILILLSLCGCGKNDNIPDIDSIDISTISFSIPEPYSIIGIDSMSSSISDGEQTIGGIILTDFTQGSLAEIYKDNALDEYINRVGYYPEFISMLGDNFISITLKITNPDTNEVTNQVHYLIIKENLCFDVWFDSDITTEETRALLINSIIE